MDILYTDNFFSWWYALPYCTYVYTCTVRTYMFTVIVWCSTVQYYCTQCTVYCTVHMYHDNRFLVLYCIVLYYTYCTLYVQSVVYSTIQCTVQYTVTMYTVEMVCGPCFSMYCTVQGLLEKKIDFLVVLDLQSLDWWYRLVRTWAARYTEVSECPSSPWFCSQCLLSTYTATHTVISLDHCTVRT